MLTFMDYVFYQFGTSTGWNHDNSYSSLTATSDSLLSLQTPSTLSLYVSSLSTPYFATAYTLSTLGQIDGSISYLYSTAPLGHVPSRSSSIPLRTLARGYRDIRLPAVVEESDVEWLQESDTGKPTLFHATLALPPPSVLTALYARRINPQTLLSISLNSKSIPLQSAGSGPPPASVLAHIQHDTGRYSIEGLGSTDNALLGIRALWNFGLGPPNRQTTPPLAKVADIDIDIATGSPSLSTTEEPPTQSQSQFLAGKPSLLSAGAEFYYSPFSHVIGLSTGLRFTTLTPSTNLTLAPIPSPSKPLAGTSSAFSMATNSLLTPSNIPHSSFPYTMTLTLTPLTGSLASTYSVRPTPHLALSSRFDFNVYSWESRYVLGAEIWRRRRRRHSERVEAESDPLEWAREKVRDWWSEEEGRLKRERVEREEENVINLRVDDGWNIRALWTGRVKELVVSVGCSVAPVKKGGLLLNVGEGGQGHGSVKRWSGTVGAEIAYST